MGRIMIQIKQLKNGIKCVCETMPHLRSISIGLWIGNGSRHEKLCEWGVSHFIEHMLFKGTTNRSSRDIAEFTDGFGGQLNGYTYRDKTCFYITATDEFPEECFDILSDMLLRSKFDLEDIASEKRIVFEEMSMDADNAEELVDDLIDEACFCGQAFGRNILGSVQSVEIIDKRLIEEYMAVHYTAENVVVSVAGNIEAERAFELAEKYLGNMKKSIEVPGETPAIYTPGQKKYAVKDIEQTHINLAFCGLPRSSENIYALDLANNILGGGISSRLFQKIREEMGIAYSVVSSISAFSDCGSTSLYAAISPENEERAKEQMLIETKKLKKDLKKEELERSKKQVISGFILSSESAEGQMAYNGKQLIYKEEIQSTEDYIEKINSVDMNRTMEVLEQCFNEETLCEAVVRAGDC